MEDNRPAPGGKKYSVRYPWDKWFKKKKFSLAQGKDYWCAPHGMAQMVRNKAKQSGFSVSLKLGDAGVIEVKLTPIAGGR